MLLSLQNDNLFSVLRFLNAADLARVYTLNKGLSKRIDSVATLQWLHFLSLKWNLPLGTIRESVLSFRHEIALQNIYAHAHPVISGITSDDSDIICNAANITADFVGRVGENNRSVQGTQPFPRVNKVTTKASITAPLTVEGAITFVKRYFGTLITSSPFNIDSIAKLQMTNRTDSSTSFSVPFVMGRLDGSTRTSISPGSLFPLERYRFSIKPRSVAYYEVQITRLAPKSAALSRANSFGNLLTLPHQLAEMEQVFTQQQQQMQQQQLQLQAAQNQPNNDPGGFNGFGTGGDVFECVAVGLATKYFQKHKRFPGWDSESYGYHGDDGAIFHGRGRQLSEYGPTFGFGDVVGCGLDYVTRSVFYTLNGTMLGTAFEQVPIDLDLYPTVGIDANCSVQFNFGMQPFHFDLLACIEGKMGSVSTATA